MSDLSVDDRDSRELRDLIDLTLKAHGIKRRIDLLRSRVDARARAQFATTGIAPTWKLPKLGQIRLDGIDPDPTAYVADPEAFTTWLAQRHPTEVTATIEVPAEHLEAALEVLGFAEVPTTPTVVPRAAGADTVLKRVTLIERDETGPLGERTWDAFDPETGGVVDGVQGRISSAPRLVVAADGAVKTQVNEEAKQEDARLYPPLDDDGPAGATHDDDPAADNPVPEPAEDHHA